MRKLKNLTFIYLLFLSVSCFAQYDIVINKGRVS